MLRRLCHDEDVAISEVGKVVFTKSHDELQQLYDLAGRAKANGVNAELVDEGELRKLEPLAKTTEAALWSPRTAVADPMEGTRAIGRVYCRLGGELKHNSHVEKIVVDGQSGRLNKCLLFLGNLKF